MWNKHEEIPPAKFVPNRPTPVEPVKPELPQAMPPRETAIRPVAPAPPSQGGSATIGASMVIVGEIHSREELTVDGEVEGKLELQHRLTVGPNGKVKAAIKAREVVVYGNVQGNIEVSDKITIRKSGSVVGDIRTAGIVIDDGAYFKGGIDIVKAPPIVTTQESRQVPA